jgi:uroporphyrinogen-III synthase
MTGCNLGGRGVLVTRAAHQSAGLCRLIDAHGGRAVAFPAVEIAPPADPEAAIGLLRQPWDVAIFISPNAVTFADSLMGAERLSGARIGAVGRATAKALARAGYSVDLIPGGRYDSEGLLTLPALQRMDGCSVLIVRGQGGRPLLGDSLRARGAKVGYAEVYRRVRPQAECAPLLGHWSSQIDLVTVTSGELLDNLVGMLGEAGWPLLRRTPLLVISERMREAAERRGFEHVLQAAGGDDTALMDAICGWAGQQY